MTWFPHITVAAIVYKDGKFLMVEEKEDDGTLVINQPAGHLEANESLIDAVVRETREETGWTISADALLSMNLYTSPKNDITYFRCNFIASAITRDETAEIDPDIVNVLWLSKEEIDSNSYQLRSPLVSKAINDYLSGQRYPLSIISELADKQ